MSATVQNGTKKERAALLLAEDELSDQEIADRIDIGRTTLSRWKRDPEFTALVGDRIGQIQAGMLKLAIAKKHKRLETLDTLHTKSLQVIEHRAARYRSKLGTDDVEAIAAQAARSVLGSAVPGEAITGLLVEKETISPQGMTSTEWSVDVALLKEIRAQHEQAAKELGQWVEKGDLNVSGGLKREYVIVTDE